MPERLSVSVQSSGHSAIGKQSNQTADFVAKARYLFGVLQLDRVSTQCFFKGMAERGPPHYTFGTKGTGAKKRHLATLESQIGKQNQILIKCPLTDGLTPVDGPGIVIAEVSVFEAGSGRVTKAIGHQSLRTTDYLIGLKAKATEFAVGQPIRVHGVLLSSNANLTPRSLELEIETLSAVGQYGRFMDHKTGRLVWKRSVARNTEGVSRVAVKDGRFEVQLTPSMDADEFIIRARYEGATTELHLAHANRVYDWEDWDQDTTSTTIRDLSS